MIDPNSLPQAPATAPPANTNTTPDAQSQPVQNTPATITPASPQTQQPSQQPQQNPQQQPAQAQQNSNQPGTVSNAPAPVHPAIQRASLLRNVATALAGGPRFVEKIDPSTGQTTRTQVPLSRGDILTALAAEAVTGALSGLAQRGPGATGRAAAAGFDTVSQQQQQAQAQQQSQAQQAFENQSNQLARRASTYEANSRAILNTSQAEAMGADAIDKLVDINRQSGVLDVDPALTENGGTPMTQAELMDAMKSGKLSPTDQLGPVTGRVEITNPDGTKRWEATHLVIKDPNTPVSLTQEQWDRFADAGVPGYPKGTKIGQGLQIPLRMMQNANEIAGSHYLATQRLGDLRDTLDGTPEASRVPPSIDFSKPGVNMAMQHFQKYVSHNADNLNDPFLALQQMGADKRDPKTGQLQPNPDAKYVDVVAQQFGGWNVLEAAHDQIAANKKTASDFAVIDSADKANAVLSAPKRFTPDQVSAAKSFLALSNEQGERKAAQDARARAVAEGSDVQAMYRFGRNPITGEQLSLTNAPDAMLVDAKGNVIPQDLVSIYKPPQNEKQTADTARQVLAISNNIQQIVKNYPNLVGPIQGRTEKELQKLGVSQQDASNLLTNITLLQSAATKAHTGRFSSEILKKMDTLANASMNPQELAGSLKAIDDVMGRYAQEDQLTTVGQYKQRLADTSTPTTAQIPAGAQLGRDAKGNVVGYKLNGQYYSLGGNQ
jgi:hypothetical protein